MDNDMFGNMTVSLWFLLFVAPRIKETFVGAIPAGASKVFGSATTYLAISMMGNSEANVQIHKMALAQLADAVQEAQKSILISE